MFHIVHLQIQSAAKLFRLFVFLAITTTLGWSDSVGKTKPAVFSIEDFPLGVGSQWVYVRVDSSSNGFSLEGITTQVVMETVTVKIVGQTQSVEGRSSRILVREFRSKVDTQRYITLFGVERPPSKERPPKVDTCIRQSLSMPDFFAVDTQYVTSIGDTVIFSKRYRVYADTTKSLYEQEIKRFVFPLEDSNTWKGAYPNDSFTVRHKESIEVIQNEFKPGFLVERRIWIPNSGGDIAYWIIPGVGLVQEENRYEFTLANEYGVERWKLINYEIKK